MNIYAEDANLRLDERQPCPSSWDQPHADPRGLARLEQEGLVRIVPRKGVYIVRKTKAEILEMITVWAALESMAARLITEHASDAGDRVLRADVRHLRRRPDPGPYRRVFGNQHPAFTRPFWAQQVPAAEEMADGLFIHMRSIRARTISDDNRADRSIVDHMHIIEALEQRDTELAERLVREHTLESGGPCGTERHLSGLTKLEETYLAPAPIRGPPKGGLLWQRRQSIRLRPRHARTT